MKKLSTYIRRSVISGIAIAAAWSCSKDTLPRGQVMLAISADVSIPKNMNQVTVEVLDEAGKKVIQSFPLLPSDFGKPMPGLLALVPPDSGGQRVRVRVRAERDEGGAEPTVRVVREAIVSVPKDRVAMLTMPLRWLCDGNVQKSDSDGGYTTKCAEGKTCAGGECVDDEFDSDALPDYDPAKVFGGGDESGSGGSCINVQKCFGSSVAVTPTLVGDVDCVIPLPSGADADSLNLAFTIPHVDDTTDGHCTTGRAGGDVCYIPIDRDPVDGWRAIGDQLHVPKGVCNKIANEPKLGLALTTACPSKDVTVPICGPWTNVKTESTEGPVSGEDGGTVTAPDSSVIEPHVDGGEIGAGGRSSFDSGVSTCAADPIQLQAKNTDLYFVVETAGTVRPSMTTITKEIDAALNDPAMAGVSVALRTFGGQCGGPGLFSTPTVSFDVLPGAAPAFMTALQSGGTDVPDAQTDIAITDSLQAVHAHASGNGVNAAMVVITSGSAGTCTSDLTMVSSTLGRESTKILLVGFPSGADSNATQFLTAVGSGPSVTSSVFPDGGVPPNAIANSIIALAESCSYGTPGGGVPYRSKFYVQLSNVDGSTPLPDTGDAAGCSAGVGYYLDASGASVTLCPSSCSDAHVDTAMRVEAVLGCKPPVTGGSVGPPGSGGSIGEGGGGNAGFPAGGRGGGTGGTLGPCCGPLGQCTAATPELSVFTQDTCAAGAVCAPRNLVVDGVLSTCQSVGGAEGRCIGQCNLPSIDLTGLPIGTCVAGESCAPCFDYIDGTDTGVCSIAGDSPKGPPVTAPSCCTNVGRCLPTSIAPFVGTLGQETCPSGGDLCVPSGIIQLQLPSLCSSISGVEGRCFSPCLFPNVNAANLPQSSCAANERCIPCTDVTSQLSTGACNFLGDAPGAGL